MINEIFKNPNPNRLAIISETGNVYYIPATLTIRETEEILYALYGVYIDWTTTTKRNFSTEEIDTLAYVLRRYTSQYPEKTLAEVFNSNNLRTYAEEIFAEALWHDIQDAKER